MPNVKANWHLDVLDLNDDDPMQGDIAKFAKPIDLDKSKAEIRAELQATIRKESRYFNSGIECDLKWTVPGLDGTPNARNPCHECPHFTDDFDGPGLALLCAVGRQQNDLLDRLDAIRDHETALDDALVASFTREQAEIEEYVQAVT